MTETSEKILRYLMDCDTFSYYPRMAFKEALEDVERLKSALAEAAAQPPPAVTSLRSLPSREAVARTAFAVVCPDPFESVPTAHQEYYLKIADAMLAMIKMLNDSPRDVHDERGEDEADGG